MKYGTRYVVCEVHTNIIILAILLFENLQSLDVVRRQAYFCGSVTACAAAATGIRRTFQGSAVDLYDDIRVTNGVRQGAGEQV
jgi:hypothetical protein